MQKFGLYRANQNEVINLAISNLVKWNGEVPKKNFQCQVLDFFCGAGGMSLGFAAISKDTPYFKCIAGFDISEEAAKTYSNNFKVPALTIDIRKLIDKKLLSAVLNDIGYDPKKPLIVIGCPPCQGFTSHRKKNWETKDDRNDLVGIFASIAVQLNPDCIVIENVPEMLSKKYWIYYSKAKSRLEKAGYIVHQKIFNTASFGVPQERYRAISMAMKKEFVLPEPILRAENYRTVRDAIGYLPAVKVGETTKTDPFHKPVLHRQSTIDVIKAVPKNGGSRPKGIGPKCLDRVKGFADVYGRLSWDKPAITITQYARNPASGRFTHPEQNRGLTIREASLLQGFPLGFYFLGSSGSIYKQIGEAVPPIFGCAIAATVLIELLSWKPLSSEETARQRIYTNTPVNNSYSSVIAGIKIAAKKKWATTVS